MSDGIVCHVNELDTLSDAIYIGRRANRFGLVESPFHNPFLVKDLGRQECLRQYIDHLIGKPELLRQLPELRGRPLACWCRRSIQTDPPCHGDVLLALLKQIPDELLRDLDGPMTCFDPGVNVPSDRVVYTSAAGGGGIYVIEIAGMGDQIYRDLFPITWSGAAHG